MIMMTRKCKFNKYIDDYMYKIRSGKTPASKELHQAMDYIEEKLSNDDVIIKHDMIDKAIELTERYFDMKLLDWELFFICYNSLLL